MSLKKISPQLLLLVLHVRVWEGYPTVCALPLVLPDEQNVEAIDVSHLGLKAFGRPSPHVGKLVETHWNESSEVNPEELGQYAEGDILFPGGGRNGLVAETARWKGGVIPYEISGGFTQNDRSVIQRAMDIYHKYTCVRFRPRQSSDSDYLSITGAPTGCWSSVGRVGGRQQVNLQPPACTTKVGTPLHELAHAAGFLHEQNRPERDEYVTIAWGNIKKGHESNFDKADKDKTNGFGVPYDFRSVMHYSSTAFSANGRPTIIPKDSMKVEKMGQREGFSKGDLMKINTMYNCPEKTEQVIGSLHGGNTGTNNGNTTDNKENQNSNFFTNVLGFLFH